MAGYNPDFLRRLRTAVDEFGTAFENWAKTQDESDILSTHGFLPTMRTKDGEDPAKVRTLELDVAEAAGAASRAVTVTGAHIGVVGFGPLDPLANWALMSAPKALFSAQDVRNTVATVRGRLRLMIDEAEATVGTDLPAFAPAQFHPVVWSAAAAHWTNHQYRVAVREAAEALNVHWKDRVGRHDVDDTSFWQQTLSAGEPSPGKPKLAWPGTPTDKTTKSMRGGLEPLGSGLINLSSALKDLAAGLNLTVRNVTTHTRDELTEQEAMERLAAYSYLARLLDRCELRTAQEPAQQ
ncbi:TIGR02391 family protein [Kitasatospora sp. MBT63]|uniref:TIGR02391 family protein n=1 Tax=Kitasatospora sp. MBT63 TaxID=1444768 RepID=UPI00053996F6|nr:TIGR02391 family protein [Kitasatospora sp. MBT63]